MRCFITWDYRPQRFRSAGTGKLDLRYRCFGADTQRWFQNGARVKNQIGPIEIEIFIISFTCSILRLRRSFVWCTGKEANLSSTCPSTNSSWSCTFNKVVCCLHSFLLDVTIMCFSERKNQVFCSLRFRRAARLRAESKTNGPSLSPLTVNFNSTGHDDGDDDDDDDDDADTGI